MPGDEDRSPATAVPAAFVAAGGARANEAPDAVGPEWYRYAHPAEMPQSGKRLQSRSGSLPHNPPGIIRCPPFPQYVTIMTPFLTKAPLSRLSMMRFSLASHRYPETNSADRTSAPIAPNKSCTSPSALSSPPHDTPHLRSPRKRQAPPGSLSLWVYVTHGPMRRSSKYPSRTPSRTALCFPLPYRRHRSGKIQQDCYGQHPTRQDDEPQHGEKYLHTSSSP